MIRLIHSAQDEKQSYVSMFIANKRGYYLEEGLAVEIILIASLLGTKALMGGSMEFASASKRLDALGQNVRPKDLTVL